MGTCALLSQIEEGKILNGLQSKDNFDNVRPLNGKPSVVAEGFNGRKTSDLVAPKSVDGDMNNPILSEAPNLYKQTGALMSKIPFSFIAIPEYFYVSGWLPQDNDSKFFKMMKFLHWSFKKCSSGSKRVPFDGKMIELGPYEFIYGRTKSAEECGLTVEELRHQLKIHLNAKFIEKAPSSTPTRFTVYRWITDSFTENNPQLNPQLNPHKSDDRKKKRDKEDHPSIPSFENEGNQDGKIDDLFSKEENKNKIHVFSGKYHNENPLHIYLTQEQYDECLKVRGSKDQIIKVIEVVANWKQRKYEIKDWFKTIMTWNYRNTIADKTIDNEKLGKQIQELYGECTGWNARIYRDNLKDVRGILFESTSSMGNTIPIFVPFTDGEFKEKCLQVIKQKNMKRKGEK